MQNAALAALYHYSSTDDNPQNLYCPEGSESWCKWQKAQAMNQSYEHPPAFNKETFDMMLPVYEDLTSESLLQRCLGSNTQNNNESFNQTVWRIAPKHTFNGSKISEISAMLSACIFNEGYLPILKIIECMGVTVGRGALCFVTNHDATKLYVSERKSTEASKEARIAEKRKKAEEKEKLEIVEGTYYMSGFAD